MKSATLPPALSIESWNFAEAEALPIAEDAEDEMESAMELPDDNTPSDGPAVAEEANDEAELY